MPKQKTNSSAKKRFKLKKSGVIKRNKQKKIQNFVIEEQNEVDSQN